MTDKAKQNTSAQAKNMDLKIQAFVRSIARAAAREWMAKAADKEQPDDE